MKSRSRARTGLFERYLGLQVAGGDQPAETGVSIAVAHQGQEYGRSVPRRPESRRPLAGRSPAEFHPQDGIESVLARGLDEGDGGVETVAIGQSESVVPECNRGLGQFLRAHYTAQQRTATS